MSITAAKLGYQALRDIGCLRPGQTTSSDVLLDILDALNQTIDSAQLDKLMMFTTSIAQYNLTAGLQSYSIGPAEVAPNFTAPRPTKIEYANLIINTTAPTVRRPIEVIQDQKWAAIRVQQIPFALPMKLYYDGGFSPTSGAANIMLRPGPLSNYQLELFTWQQLQSFADLSTAYTMPPGYALWLRKALAVSIAPMMVISSKLYRLTQPRPPLIELVQRQEAEARVAITNYNGDTPILPSNPAYTGRSGSWNYAIGEAS